MADSRGGAGPGHSAERAVGMAAAASLGDGAPARAEKVYVVRPPAGRFHQSLWEIAERCLGDGRRYREIFELNKDRPQPDGGMLTIASLIRPGWVLRMPWEAHGPGVEVVRVGLPGSDSLPRAARRAAADPAAVAPLPEGQALADAEPLHAGLARWPPAPPPRRRARPEAPARDAPAPARDAPAPGRPAGAAARPPHRPPAARGETGGSALVPAALAVTGLFAAGVLAALERRRRQQLWRRTPGRRVASPGAPAARAETVLLQAAAPDAAAALDFALRLLARELAGQGRTPPTLLAAHHSGQTADLWISPPQPDPPIPWSAEADGQVWRLRLDVAWQGGGRPGALASDGAPAGPLPAPYPCLVAIGSDATGEVLVDLAAMLGVVAVTGPGQSVRAALTAIAAALATSASADSLRLVLAGFGAGAAALAPDRVRAVDTVADAVAVLGRAAAWAAGPDTVSETPCLISLAPPSAAEREALLELGQRAPCLVGGETPGAMWTWEVDEEGRLLIAELGLEVEANLVPPQERDAIVDLFHVASDAPAVQLRPPAMDAAPAAHLADGTAAVEVALLGPPAVRAAGPIHPDQLSVATEIVIYLAAHPAGVRPNALAAAIWPRGIAPQEREFLLERVADWLGADRIGRPHLAADAGGRLRLGSGVRIDWQVFQAMIARAFALGEEERWLAGALGLVRGPFLAGRPRGRYTWLAGQTLEAEVGAWVADAAHRLCELRLSRGEPRAAVAAARRGLSLARYDESLWRDLLTAAHATGDDRLLREAISQVGANAPAGHAVSATGTQTHAGDLPRPRSPREAPA